MRIRTFTLSSSNYTTSRDVTSQTHTRATLTHRVFQSAQQQLQRRNESAGNGATNYRSLFSNLSTLASDTELCRWWLTDCDDGLKLLPARSMWQLFQSLVIKTRTLRVRASHYNELAVVIMIVYALQKYGRIE